jgi:hypothetical protein
VKRGQEIYQDSNKLVNKSLVIILDVKKKESDIHVSEV